jgi:phosphoglucosamine mutase
VTRKPDISTVPQVMESIKEVEAELGDQGRVLVRYSGTQNVCRVMVEGPTHDMTNKCCKRIAEIVATSLG